MYPPNTIATAKAWRIKPNESKKNKHIYINNENSTFTEYFFIVEKIKRYVGTPYRTNNNTGELQLEAIQYNTKDKGSNLSLKSLFIIASK